MNLDTREKQHIQHMRRKKKKKKFKLQKCLTLLSGRINNLQMSSKA